MPRKTSRKKKRGRSSPPFGRAGARSACGSRRHRRRFHRRRSRQSRRRQRQCRRQRSGASGQAFLESDERTAISGGGSLESGTPGAFGAAGRDGRATRENQRPTRDRILAPPRGNSPPPGVEQQPLAGMGRGLSGRAGEGAELGELS